MGGDHTPAPRAPATGAPAALLTGWRSSGLAPGGMSRGSGRCTKEGGSRPRSPTGAPRHPVPGYHLSPGLCLQPPWPRASLPNFFCNFLARSLANSPAREAVFGRARRQASPRGQDQGQHGHAARKWKVSRGTVGQWATSLTHSSIKDVVSSLPLGGGARNWSVRRDRIKHKNTSFRASPA